MAKTDRQLIYEKLLEVLNATSFFDLDDLADLSDEKKAEFMIEKRKIRQEFIDIASGETIQPKKKKSPFDLGRYKTHDGSQEKGSPDKWRQAAKIILNVNDENCLTTLGLSGVPASKDDLKKAYRSLIKKAHPDREGGSEDEAARINAAYELALSLFFSSNGSQPTVSQPSSPKPSAKRKDTGLRPQLLTPIDEDEAIKYIQNDLWCLQEKKDGKHILIKKVGYTLTVANKQGLETTIPKCVETAIFNQFEGENVLLDGELIGNTFYIFDILGS